MTATEIALLTNAALDMIISLRKLGADITPENLDARIAERQAEIDALAKEIDPGPGQS
jgi:hypothetical protein